ncbi:hypothetical protein TIFTF001_016094 [Ficus carica]|uniref:Myb/SANT-like domain-containing protein n=1 Tax=Ficus carica TaxID=3494 RepID=A0AA88D8G5_FICCA|nr:hypothetical protein TIFTF001_016094 [Ficus carica]
MPRKSSGETYVWNSVKERRKLEKLDDFYSSNPGRQPAMQIYDLWANEFNTEFGGVPAHGSTLYQKKERMRKIYKGWKVLKVQTGLGYDSVVDRVVCSDEAWQSFIKCPSHISQSAAPAFHSIASEIAGRILTYSIDATKGLCCRRSCTYLSRYVLLSAASPLGTAAGFLLLVEGHRCQDGWLSTWRARQDDLILVTSHAYITQFPKFALLPQKFKFLHLCPLGVGRSLAALEPKFCLPHHDDIILMTSCAYIMLTSLISKNYTFAPKGKILTKMPPRHLRYEGLRHKELQYNVFDKTHAAGAFGYGSVTMGDDNNPSVDYDFNFANSETHPFLEEDVPPTAGGWQADTRQGPDVAGPSRRSGSLGKRKQRDATDAMANEAMEEVRDYFRGISQTGGDSEQSVQNGGLLQCMNIIKGMGYSSRHQMMMWHYFVSNQNTMGTFCQIDDDLRREIIASVINP